MDTMDTMGRHVIAELWDCDFDKLNDMPYIEQLFVDAALELVLKCVRLLSINLHHKV